jgi:DNA-binding CsgD family transcriptional regulator
MVTPPRLLATEASGEHDRGLTWVIAAERGPGDRRPLDCHDTPPDHAALLRATAEARNALRDAAVAAANAAGRARSVAEVLDEALAVLTDAETAPSAAFPPGNASRQTTVALSPREKEVLALVAEGRSNKAIAEALVVSPNTVKTHVASLLRKCDAGTRVRLAAMVAAMMLPGAAPAVEDRARRDRRNAKRPKGG